VGCPRQRGDAADLQRQGHLRIDVRCVRAQRRERHADEANAFPRRKLGLSPKFYQLRRNQRSLPSSANVPVTFVLDSVGYWRSSLGMEAWIKQGHLK
jgi:hypothetical protein